jgi:hypothetical protein
MYLDIVPKCITKAVYLKKVKMSYNLEWRE